MDETSVTLAFADGDYTFFLPMQRLIAAEREMKCSLFEAFYNLGNHVAGVEGKEVLAGPSPATLPQCQALIRNGLIGGGQTEERARELVETYCYPARAAILDAALAFKVARAAIYGVQTAPKKKADQPVKRRRSKKAS
jgi:hypothetical protein